MMQALEIVDFVQYFNQLSITNVPIPEIQDGFILVRVAFVGLNYVDLLYAKGAHQNNRRHIRPPFIAGQEFSGEVVETGTDAFAVGDLVYGAVPTGAFAEYLLAPSFTVRKVPSQWSLRGAAGMAATLPVSYGALARIAKIRAKEDVVLIHAAAGGLGVAAVQVAHAHGCRVIATVGSESKARVVESLGVAPADVINYSEPGWEKAVMERTGSRGVDVVFDSVGLVQSSIRCCAYNARLLVIGFAGREGNLEKLPVNRVLLKSIQLLGYRYGEHSRQFPGEHSAVWDGLEKLVSSGQIRPVVYDKSFYSLHELPAAMNALQNREVWGQSHYWHRTRAKGGENLIMLCDAPRSFFLRYASCKSASPCGAAPQPICTDFVPIRFLNAAVTR